jgi:L-alanine-DL-glutamate epimerase-like enolase superfamily enzyme
MRIAVRHYTVVHVRDAEGVVGSAFAQTRHAPVAAVVERLVGPAVVGLGAEDVAARCEDMWRGTIAVGRGGLVGRAISLVDAALWDARGRRAGRPVFELLGHSPRRVPVMYVAGYPRAREDLDDVVATAVAAAARGHRTVKIARAPDRSLTRNTIERLDAELPVEARIVVDANWAWSGVDDALAELGDWPPNRIAWVEDPLVPEAPRALADLRTRAPMPIAAGDDLTDPTHVRRLLAHDAVDVLRLDVAAVGGITPAAPLAAEAASAGVPVSFHISPETSIHLALSCGADIESFDRDGNPFDPSHELVTGGPAFADGMAEPSPEPGLGFTLTAAAPTR